MHGQECHGGRRFRSEFGSGYWFGGGGRRFGVFPGFLAGSMSMGGRAFRAGRRLASGELQLVLLALLAERPSHGYELIKALEERSGGFYSPSPGMIYPALTWLEEVGYASVAAEGLKKQYSITDSGRAYLRDHRDAADAMLSQLDYIGRKMSRVHEIFGGSDAEAAAPSDIDSARRELRRALQEKRDAAGDEKSRIAAILRSAAAQIRGKG